PHAKAYFLYVERAAEGANDADGPLSAPGQQGGELPGQRRARRAVLVLEVDEGAAGAKELADRSRPARQRLRRVLDGAEAEVAPVRRGHRGRRALLVIDDAERDVPAAQQPVDLLVEPGGMAELEGDPQVGREQIEHPTQALHVLLEVRRELEEQRTELPPEEAGRVAEVANGILHLLQALEVRDLLRGLEREGEVIGGGGRPAGHRLGIRQPVEGVVDLDGREALRIVRKHLACRESLWVEGALPLRIVVAGGSDAEARGGEAGRRGRHAVTSPRGRSSVRGPS